MMTRLVKRVQINVKIKHIIRQFKFNLTSKSHLISNTQFRPKVCLKLMSESMFETKFDKLKIQIFQINSFFVFIKFFRGSSSIKNDLDPNFFKFFKLYIFFKLHKNTTFFFFFYFRRTDGRTDERTSRRLHGLEHYL
jgi:hypothetical protein